MQSFLQYRRTGLAVQKQLARDQEKATTWAEGPCRTAQPALASTYEAPTTVLGGRLKRPTKIVGENLILKAQRKLILVLSFPP
ncbi:hypothetical protein V1506DRAFT_550271 [Lipomyces tetrasporus]